MCRTLDEWNVFIENFRKSCSKKNSSIKDRQLLERLIALNADLPDIYSRKDRERHRRWTSYEPKRTSTRLEVKRQQRLEFEEITQEQKARHDKFLEFKRRQEETIAKEKERFTKGAYSQHKNLVWFQLIEIATNEIIGSCGFHLWYFLLLLEHQSESH